MGKLVNLPDSFLKTMDIGIRVRETMIMASTRPAPPRVALYQEAPAIGSRIPTSISILKTVPVGSGEMSVWWKEGKESVPRDHLHGVGPHQAQCAEVTAISGEDPGIPPSLADVAIYMLASKARAVVGHGRLHQLSQRVPPITSGIQF